MKKRSLILVLVALIMSLSFVSQVFAQTGCIDASGNPIPCPNRTPETDDDTPTRPDDIPDDTDGDGTADPLDRCPNRPGDGANGGCPEGVDPNNPGEETVSSPAQALQLLAAPPSDDCIASPDGTYDVNMRVDPNPYSPVLHILEANEWAKVLYVSHEGGNPFGAEHEFGNMMQPLGLTIPDSDPDPDPDPEYDPDALWLFVQTEDFHMGWIALDVARLAGDCVEFDELDNDPDYLDVLILPDDDGGILVPGGNGFLTFPTNPGPDPLPTFEFDIRLPDDGGDESLDIAIACVWVEIGAGGMILECLDGTTPSFIYCLTQEVGEAGHFEEVCYQIELPDGCTMTSSEAGVWHMECEPDGQVEVTPIGENNPALIVRRQGQALIALLLPAVQQARESAR